MRGPQVSGIFMPAVDNPNDPFCQDRISEKKANNIISKRKVAAQKQYKKDQKDLKKSMPK